MRSLVVVVPHILVEDPLEVATTPDQHPSQALLSNRPHPPLGERACARRLDGRRDDLDAVGREHAVEGAVNLLSRSRMRNQGVVAPSGRSIDSSRAYWTTQGPFGWRVTPTRRTRRVPSSIMNKT